MKNMKEFARKNLRRGISAALAAAMLLGSAANIRMTASASQRLPMPEYTGPNLMHKQAAENTGIYYKNSLSEQMLQTGYTGDASAMRCNPTKVWNSLKGKCIQGLFNWSITYEGTNYDFQSDDIVYRLRASVGNTRGWTMLGDGITGETYSEEHFCQTESTPWMKYVATKVVIKGSGASDIRDVDYVLADLTAPGEDKDWTYEIGEDGEKPVLWLDFGEQLRPANGSITLENLADLRLKLGILPTTRANDRNTELILVTAHATKYSLDATTRIGFQITDADWEMLPVEEYQIITVEDCSLGNSYNLKTYMVGGGCSVNAPMTDVAGNPVALPQRENVQMEDLVVDRVAPSVLQVELFGPKKQKLPLYATNGTAIHANVDLSELLGVTKEALSGVKLEWNVLIDGKPVSTGFDSLAQTLPSANMNNVSVLVFKPLIITGDMTPQGVKIAPVRITGASVLKDRYGNQMPDVVELAAPAQQIILDTKAPTIAVTDVVRQGITAEGKANYIIELEITGGDGSTIRGQTGLLSLASYPDAPDIPYAYEIVASTEEAPGTLSQSGTIQATATTPVSFPLTHDGIYRLYLQLSDVNTMELDEAKGITLYATLTDEAGNQGQTSVKIANLGIDHGVPTLALSSQGVTVSRVDDTTNRADFSVAYSAADRNALGRVEYQWLEVDQTPAENGWTVISVDGGKTNTRGVIPTSVSGTDVASRKLVVRVYDAFENYAQQEITVTADMTRAVGRQELQGQANEPLHTNDILVCKPSASDTASEAATNYYTRAVVRFVDYETNSTATDYVWVRVFDFAGNGYESANLLDTTYINEWYCVRIDGNDNYSMVYTGAELADDTLPHLDHYGEIQVEFASSADINSLIPVKGASAALPATDTTAHTDSSFTFLHTASRNDAYGLDFGAVTDSQGNVPETGNSSYDVYYKFNRSMAGARIHFTIANTLRPEWGIEELDFENSYAVLLRAEANGDYDPATGEVSQRQSLSRSLEQVYIVPDTDKDGAEFTSGAYILQVHLAQKAGGSKDFFLRDENETSAYHHYLMLDAAKAPQVFGITDYAMQAHVVYDDNMGISMNKTAPAGEVISYINVGVAKPTQHYGNQLILGEDSPSIITVDGKPGYALETYNALRQNFSQGGGGASFYLYLKATQSGDNDNGTWLGFQAGRITGIKYWNAGSTGDPAALGYETPRTTTNEDGSTQYSLAIDTYPDWYSLESNAKLVMTREELAAKSLEDFVLVLGANTICYQLQMANGVESPVYQFQLNLFDQAPQIELDWEFVEPQLLVNSTSENLDSRKYAKEILVTATDAYSPYGGVELYLANYDSANRTWSYTPYAVGDAIPLNQNGDGYSGIVSTRKDLANDSPMVQFICAVDSVGNAVCAYPILSGSEEIEDSRFPYGIGSPATVTVDSIPAYGADGNRSYESNRIVFNKNTCDPVANTIDYFTIQVGDRAPVMLQGKVDINTEDGKYNDRILKAPNAAGISGYGSDQEFGKQISAYYTVYAESVRYDLPYDPTIPEGTSVTHTVTLVTYSYPDYSGERMENTYTFQVTAPNTRPYVYVTEENAAAVAKWEALRYNCWPNLKRVDRDEYNPFRTYHDLQPYENKVYQIDMMDKYGQEYTMEVPVENLPADPVVVYSTTEPTTGEVTVTVSSHLYNLSVTQEDFESDYGANGTVTGNNTQELVLTFRQNSGAYVTMTPIAGLAEDESAPCFLVEVNNIYSGTLAPKLLWSYTGEPMEAEGNLVYREVTVWLVDANGSELIDPNTGKTPEYTFALGSKEGDSFVFSGYRNEYGATGADVTATLGYNLSLAPTYDENGTVTEPPADIWAPDLALTGYTMRRGTPREIKAAYKLIHERSGDPVVLPNYEDENKYGAANVYTDLDAFLARMNWGEGYTFRVDVVDESETRLFLKAPGTNQAPSFASGTSDTIEGVTLQGRTVLVTKNTPFLLYAVDSSNNASVLAMNITGLGDAPAPEVQQVVTTENLVRIYLEAPSVDYSQVQITNQEAVLETEENSAFFGKTYLEQEANGKVTVYYSYLFEGDTYTGTMEVSVTGIDEVAPSLVSEKWSANYDPAGKRLTNQEISAQFTVSRGIYTVEGDLPDGVAISWLEDRLTVVYEKNAPGLQLSIVAMNHKRCTLNLPAVTTIDTTKPTVTVGAVEYTANHTGASVTVQVNEPAMLQDLGGVYARVVNLEAGVPYTLTVTQKGAMQLQFTDRAGNLTRIPVAVDEIVDQMMTITVKKGGVTMDPAVDAIGVGDQISVATSREATIFFNGVQMGISGPETPLEITVSEDAAGLYPSIRAVDAYGNATLVQLLRIPMGDRTAPDLLLTRTQISISLDSSDSELEQMLLENMTCLDETTPTDKLRIALSYQRPERSGIFSVTCTVTDEAGNTTSKICKVRQYSGKEPQVYIRHSGTEANVPQSKLLAVWEETRTVSAGEVELNVVFTGEKYKLEYVEGIRTAAQMKSGGEVVTAYTNAQQASYTLTLDQPGYYTFLLTTQERQSYLFVLYVEG